MIKIKSDEGYLRYFPFLSNSVQVVKYMDVTIGKIETTNTYNEILNTVYLEIKSLLTSDINKYKIENEVYEIIKFYISILVLRGLDNIAVARIWVRDYQKKIKTKIKFILQDYKTQEEKIQFFLDMFRLLSDDGQFKLKRVTNGGEVGFAMHMNNYLDVADSLFDDTSVLAGGYVIFPVNSTDFIIGFIQKFFEKKFFRQYEKISFDISVTLKIKLVIEKLREDIINSQQVSINVKKKFGIDQELLRETERIADVERAGEIMRELEENNNINIKSFPPCIIGILDKLINQKIALTHAENLLLVSYLGRKQFDTSQIIKIFSKAVNYNKKIVDYQVTGAQEKKLMPHNCQGIVTEGLCKIKNDKTNQCGIIKSPLSYR